MKGQLGCVATCDAHLPQGIDSFGTPVSIVMKQTHAGRTASASLTLIETRVQSPAYRPISAAEVAPADHPIPPLIMQPVCKHPKVRVVAREDEVEYVECLECGEVFDADEYQEMSQESADEALAKDTPAEDA